MGSEFQSKLHQRLEELVRSHMEQLEQDISRLQRELNQSFTQLLELTDTASAIPDTDDGLARILAEVEGQLGEANAQSARLGSDLALLRDSVDELGSQTTQAEVLNTLVDRAANFAPRVVLFVVKGTNALGWSAMGLDESLGKNTVRGLSISLQSDTVLKAAMDSQQTFYSSADQQRENSLLIGRLGHIHPDRVVAAPLKVRGKCAAILYADSGDRGTEAISIEAVELLVSTTGLVVELTSLRSRVGDASHAGEAKVATGSLQGQAAAHQTGSLPGRPGPHPSAPMAGQAPVQQRTSGPLPHQAGQPGQAPAQRTSGDLKPAAPQPAPQPASAPSASPAYFKPAAEAAPAGVASVQPHHAAEPPRAAAAPKPTAAPPVANVEEEKQHNDARRFARLLVSEIKLYNEQKVVEGRSNRDLYDRLKEDIDRSRQMYEKRISPNVATKFDYFYDELVNTLAEGDPAKLGSDFPGPTVRAM
ncbi:MAG TPA: hypothetical protein VEZ90_02800 [Blastocatellia bacterium]|nr:hypothetical protein [Blastocatellia bacterium]